MGEGVLREAEGIALPTVGKWEIDPNHTTVEFVARHMLTKVRGRFREVSGGIDIAERPEDSRVEVEIAAASIDTNTAMRDDDLRSERFLDVERFPRLTFSSTALRSIEGTRFELAGDLTIRDVTREVVLDCEYIGSQPDPYGNTVASFSAKTEIDREDFGMTWNVVMDAGSVLVGKRVQIELEIEVQFKG
ncbi:MAG: YceI family protein [Actinobacteria bacterium]|nr:YceI family protein [Actinomycetota bacterium]